MQQSMEFVVIEEVLMAVMAATKRWILNKISYLIKSKWYNQNEVTRELYLDKLKVLHESENFVAVDKLPDLIFNTNPPDTRLSLYEQLAFKFPHLIQPKLSHGFYVAHRLDYSTSGVVLVPLTKRAAAVASKQFEYRQTRKFYLALVWGNVKEDFIDIRVDIGKDTSEEWANIKMAPADSPVCCDKPRDARTKLLVLERGLFRNKPATKVLLSPITGRRHQLRVHCDYLGHTIVGDFTYSNRKDVLSPRMFLHAHRLIFRSNLEDLDLVAEDSFTPENFIDWKINDIVCDLNDAFDQIHCDDLQWKVVEALAKN